MNFYYDYLTHKLTDCRSGRSFVLHDDFSVTVTGNNLNFTDGEGMSSLIDDKAFEFIEIYNEIKITVDRILASNNLSSDDIKHFHSIIYSFYLLFFEPYTISVSSEQNQTLLKKQKHILTLASQFLRNLKVLSETNFDFIPSFLIISEISCRMLRYQDKVKNKIKRQATLNEKGNELVKKLIPFFEKSVCPEDYKGGPDGPISDGYARYEQEYKNGVSYSTFRRYYQKWEKMEKLKKYQRIIREKYQVPESDPKTGEMFIYDDDGQSRFVIPAELEK